MKAALRRSFARSELHKKVLQASIVQYSDPARPRVKTWCRCAGCKQLEAKSYMDVDHLIPWVPLHLTWEDWVLAVGIEATVEALWCDESNLQVLCPKCHDAKSAGEAAQRKVLCPRKSRKKKACVTT